MGSLIEMLATRKKVAPPPTEGVLVLPMVRKEHEGECGPDCACGHDEEGGCCGG